jgi:thiol-disulfide isomerase/thioredoxin
MRSPTRSQGLSLYFVAFAWAAIGFNAPPDQPLPSVPATQSVASEIDFADSLEMALALNADAPKPIVIQFGATWCGWCRKLESETLKDPLVLAMVGKFGWVHADVDKQPELASRFGARALPHAVIIDGDGRVLADLKGFADAKGYVAFLVRGEAAYVPSKNEPVDPAKVPERVRTLITTMAPASATGREQCVEAIRRLGAASLPPLVELLADERLGVRAAAGFSLGELAATDIGFDPLGSAQERAARLGRWKAWLATEAAKTLRPATAAGAVRDGEVNQKGKPKPDGAPKGTPQPGVPAKPAGNKIATCLGAAEASATG